MVIKLEDYTWGMGLEHEMHIFHSPIGSNKKIKNFILFNAEKYINEILNDKDNIDDDDYEFLKKIPFELTGRRCNGKSVIEPVPIKMPEIITDNPFCSIKSNRSIRNMTTNIIRYRERLYRILMKNKEVQKLVYKYGELSEYPFGMTRYLKCPLINNNGKYIFEKDKKGNDIILPEYNGSYHITFTLPYTKQTTDKEFIKMHKNFCNQLQWIEPLLLTAYFTGDEYSPGSLTERVRGSFRVMIIGWGNFAGTDIRLLDTGIGRYAKTKTFWRKGLNFKDVDKLKPCYKPSPSAIKEKAITTLSSDIRTFGSPDPTRPMHRESGIGMTKPNGIEFRIFDQFSDIYLESLVRLVSLIAENSRVTKTTGYVYENKIWINELHNIMTYGYKAHLSKEYINLLRKKLGLEIKTESIIGIDIFNQVYKELYDKNIEGVWSKIFNCSQEKLRKYAMPNINKKAWQFAFMLKLNNDDHLLEKFNFLSKYLNKIKIINFFDFSKSVLEIFSSNWGNDIDDIAYFYESLNVKIFLNQKHVKLYKNEDGTINKIHILKRIPKYYNFNKEIILYFNAESSFVINEYQKTIGI